MSESVTVYKGQHKGTILFQSIMQSILGELSAKGILYPALWIQVRRPLESPWSKGTFPYGVLVGTPIQVLVT